MHIYQGRIYRTRDGQRVYIYKQLGPTTYRGRIISGINKGKCSLWSYTGRWSDPLAENYRGRDLITQYYIKA